MKTSYLNSTCFLFHVYLWLLDYFNEWKIEFSVSTLFRKEVFTHSQARLQGTVILKTPRVYSIIGLVFILITAASLLFLFSAEYARKVKVTGLITPSLGLIDIYSDKNGIIQDVFVREGQNVEEGMPLFAIASKTFSDSGDEFGQKRIAQYEQQLINEKQKLNRRRELEEIEKQALQKSLANLESRKIQIEKKRVIIRERIAVKTQLVQKIESLAKTGNISDFEFKRQKDGLLSLQQQSTSLDGELLQILASINETYNSILQHPHIVKQDIAILNSNIKNIQINIDAAQRDYKTIIVAQASGKISGILFKRSQKVTNSSKLVSIIPENSVMQAELSVPAEGIGMIDIGQSVKIKYSAYPYQRFGFHTGEIIEVTESTVQTLNAGNVQAVSYRVIVKLDEQSLTAYGRDFQVKPGLQVQADITTEKRSLIQWLFDPLYSLKGSL